MRPHRMPVAPVRHAVARALEVIVVRWTRRRFLGCSLCVLGGAAVKPTLATVAPPPRKRYNILLITGDDTGCELGCYGVRSAPTPNLDRLAAEGVLFTHACVAVSSCSPSRASMLTGTYPHTHGQYGLAHHNKGQVRDYVPTIPQVLGRAGYRTGLIGKFHVKPAAKFPWDYLNQRGGRDDYKFAEMTREFLTARDDRPFFLMVNFHDTHRKFTPRVKGIPGRLVGPDEVEVPPFLPDDPQVREDVAASYNSLARLDAGVGMVLEELADAGHADHTLVLFTGDNGLPFPRAKQTVYWYGLHVPFLARWPGRIEPGSVSDGLVSLVDMAPTFYELAGAPTPEIVQGKSLLPLFRGESQSGRDILFAEHHTHAEGEYYPMRTVLTPEYHYIRNLRPDLEFDLASDIEASLSWQAIRRLMADDEEMQAVWQDLYVRRPAEELYDYEADPAERHNLASDPAHRATLEMLRWRLRQWMAATDDPLVELWS
ncbi:MAG: sulfatase [Armatimonadota bacterium]